MLTMNEQTDSLSFFQIDAFASRAFEGNPAAVFPLQQWLSDELMQSIAAENNLSESVFFVPSHADPEAANDTDFRIRWFTPKAEVKLCGHATLASAYVLFTELAWQAPQVVFDSLSGPLGVKQLDGQLQMDLPAQPPKPCATPQTLIDAMGIVPKACFEGEDYFVLLESEAQLTALNPDFALIKKLPVRGVTATAPSNNFDFVSRYFAPKIGIDEDPVTGSAFSRLTPFWAERTGQTRFHAKQVSARGGVVDCEYLPASKADSRTEARVLISGHAVKVIEGVMLL